MKKRRGSIGSARASRRSKRIAEKVRVSFGDLPSHIIGHILLRLPIKSIFICKCVCRSWKTLISDPHFAKLHLQRAPAGLLIRARDPDPDQVSRILHLMEYEPENFENDDDDQFCCCDDFFINPECNSHLKLENNFKLPRCGANLVLDKRDETMKRGRQRHYISSKPEDDKFVVLNSCNGLLCLSDVHRDYVVVCNPITGEFIRLPEATRVCKIDNGRREIYCGFGLQPKTNEYKVVRISKRYWGSYPEIKRSMAVEVHTLGTSSWKNVDVDPSVFEWFAYHWCTTTWLGFPTYVSGVLHWIGFYHHAIFCFDFESERLQSFPSPPHLFKKYDSTHITMGELKGSLYICDSSSSSSVDIPVKMWIMKKYGFGVSWTKVFSIDTMSRDRWPYGGLYWPVKHFKNGAAILMYHSSNCFIYYEPEKYGFKIFKVRGTKSTFEVIPHIPNLTSLKDAVKGDDIEVLNVHSSSAEFKLVEENAVLFLAKVNVEVANVYSISSDDEE